MQAVPVRSTYDSTVRFELLDEKGNVLAGNLGENETVEYTHNVQVDNYYGGMYFTSDVQPLTTWERMSWNYSPTYGQSINPEVTPIPTPMPTVTPTPKPIPTEE